MALNLTQLATDLGHMINDMAVTMTFAGGTYSIAFSPANLGKNLEEGGFISEYDATAVAKVSDYSTLPSAGVTVGINSVTYRVEKVIKSPDGKDIRLELMTPDK